MGTRAVVLSGGGVVGIAWETGIAKGLLDGGVDVAAADLIVGTSAGSVVGSQLACGRSPTELLDAQLAPPEEAGPGLEIDPTALAGLYKKFVGVTELTDALRVEIGELALAAKTPSEERWLASFERSIGPGDWPEQRLVVTAVDTATAAFATWDRTSGVGLARAVASSCAVPGLFPPVTINGRRYMDGGMRTIANVDVAQGYDAVLVIAFIGGRPGDASGFFGRQLDEQIKELRAAGSTVDLISPDAAAIEAFGMNPMDPGRRVPGAEAGVRQGSEISRQLSATWSRTAA